MKKSGGRDGENGVRMRDRKGWGRVGWGGGQRLSKMGGGGLGGGGGGHIKMKKRGKAWKNEYREREKKKEGQLEERVRQSSCLSYLLIVRY